MALEKDFGQLDDFISNKLDEAGKEAFEQKLQADSALKQEYNFQQKVVEGIKTARTAELKSMLNNTPIPAPVGETALLTKFAAWCVVAGLLGTGVYFFYHKEEKTTTQQQPATVVQDQEDQSEETIEEATPTVEEKKNINELTVTDKKKIEVKKPLVIPTVVTPLTKEEQIAEKRKLEVFDPTRETTTNSTPEKIKEIKDGSAHEVASSAIVVETDNTSKKYTFHYQFKDETVMLYGSFEKNLYEILEFFNQNKRTVFLYYKDSYYLLNEDNDKVKPLSPISDSVLVKKLKDYRGN